MGEWRVQVSVRVSNGELNLSNAPDERKERSRILALFYWRGFEQFKAIGSTERLLKYKIRYKSRNRNTPKTWNR